MAYREHIIGTSDLPFVFIIGGRGCGKTYPALNDVATMADVYAIWLRRLDSEIDLVCNTGLFSDLHHNGKALDMDADFNQSRGIGRIYRNGEPCGYTGAVTTFAKQRGLSFADVTHIIHDELSPEAHRSYVKGEGAALLNLYETVNRNREIEGKPPVKLICLSNVVRLDTPIFLEIDGMVDILRRMLSTEQRKFTDRERGIYIEILEDAEFSEAKSKTALYKLVGSDSSIAKANIKNKLIYDDTDIVLSRKKVGFMEYEPYVSYGNLVIFRHKSKGLYYVCEADPKNAKYQYQLNEAEKFRKDIAITFRYAMRNRLIKFDKYVQYINIAQAIKYM